MTTVVQVCLDGILEFFNVQIKYFQNSSMYKTHMSDLNILVSLFHPLITLSQERKPQFI
jgi:hypothetical protein